MNKIKNLKQKFTNELKFLCEFNEIVSIFNIVINHIKSYSAIQITLNQEEELSKIEVDEINLILEELKKEKPIQYIIGETEFYGLKFKVTPDVLIPRMETEELVDFVLKSIDKKTNIKIIDIGTGSGCIPISIKKNSPNSIITAIDISEEALEIAKYNANENNCEINFIQDDILNPSFSKYINQYDIIISNPPYVMESEKAKMKNNVLNYEPHLALFVEDENPLVFYEAIIKFSKTKLSANGLIVFEFNEALGQQMIELAMKNNFIFFKILKDINGKDRFLLLK